MFSRLCYFVPLFVMAWAMSVQARNMPTFPKWRPFNLRDDPVDYTSYSQWDPFGHQRHDQHQNEAKEYAPLEPGEVKNFVDGLKSRIAKEISLLLALSEEEDKDQGNQNNIRDFFAEDQSKIRKFIPLPLVRGARRA